MITVFLPAIHAVRPEETRTAAVPLIATSGAGTILFVDDEPALQSLAQRTLEEHGYRVVLPADGREAIAVLKANSEVRAVVLDLAMPQMSGDIVGPILRESRPDLPLILSSGYPEPDVLDRVGPGVMATFLQKPYQAGMLAAKVDEALRRQQAP